MTSQEDIESHSEEDHTSDTNSNQWRWCGDKLPKEEIVFFAQVIPIYIVIVCSIVSLALERGEQHTWTVLLGSGLGYLLPNPTLTKKTRNKER